MKGMSISQGTGMKGCGMLGKALIVPCGSQMRRPERKDGRSVQCSSSSLAVSQWYNFGQVTSSLCLSPLIY